MSLPANRTRPESGVSWPLSWAIKVVLPAPFGPMIACSSASLIERLMSSVATIPPKRLARFSTRSKSGMAHLPEQAIDAAAREQHDQHQQWPKNDLPIFGDAREGFFQYQKRHGTKYWADHRSH